MDAGITPLVTDAAEVVIVNTKNKEWVAKLIYSLEKAGLKLREDYLAPDRLERTLVFSEVK